MLCKFQVTLLFATCDRLIIGCFVTLQVKRRLVVAPPSFVIKVVDKDGIRTLKEIRPIQ